MFCCSVGLGRVCSCPPTECCPASPCNQVEYHLLCFTTEKVKESKSPVPSNTGYTVGQGLGMLGTCHAIVSEILTLKVCLVNSSLDRLPFVFYSIMYHREFAKMFTTVQSLLGVLIIRARLCVRRRWTVEMGAGCVHRTPRPLWMRHRQQPAAIWS